MPSVFQTGILSDPLFCVNILHSFKSSAISFALFLVDDCDMSRKQENC